MTHKDDPAATVIMLNPFSAPVQELVEFRKHDEAKINSLFTDGYMIIDNTPSGIKGPEGILVPNFRWK